MRTGSNDDNDDDDEEATIIILLFLWGKRVQRASEAINSGWFGAFLEPWHALVWYSAAVDAVKATTTYTPQIELGNKKERK